MFLEKYALGEGLSQVLSNRIPDRGFEGFTIIRELWDGQVKR